MCETEVELVELCKSGIFPKLQFLVEDRDDTFQKEYFKTPRPLGDSSKESETLPLSILQREEILKTLLASFEEESFAEVWSSKLSPKSRAYIIIFLSENCDGTRSWSSELSQNRVTQICNRICSYSQKQTELEKKPTCLLDLRQWFIENFESSLTSSQSDFHNILQIVRSKFSISEWKYFPPSVHGFCRIVRQISHPFLACSFEQVIPPVLLFTDDHIDEHKMIGLETLSHVVNNVDKMDLMQNNWAMVVYDAASQQYLLEKDPAAVEIVVPVLTKILAVVEMDPFENSDKFTKYDDIIKKIIFQIEMCSEVNLKRTWLPLLNNFLKIMGTATLHWNDKLCNMLRDCTICNDHTMWNHILQVTSTIIQTTWMKSDCMRISEIILRVIFNISCFDIDCQTRGSIKNDIIQSAVNCFVLLRKCDGYEQVSGQLQEIIDEGDAKLLHPEFIKVLKDVLQLVIELTSEQHTT